MTRARPKACPSVAAFRSPGSSGCRRARRSAPTDAVAVPRRNRQPAVAVALRVGRLILEDARHVDRNRAVFHRVHHPTDGHVGRLVVRRPGLADARRRRRAHRQVVHRDPVMVTVPVSVPPLPSDTAKCGVKRKRQNDVDGVSQQESAQAISKEKSDTPEGVPDSVTLVRAFESLRSRGGSLRSYRCRRCRGCPGSRDRPAPPPA